MSDFQNLDIASSGSINSLIEYDDDLNVQLKQNYWRRNFWSVLLLTTVVSAAVSSFATYTILNHSGKLDNSLSGSIPENGIPDNRVADFDFSRGGPVSDYLGMSGPPMVDRTALNTQEGLAFIGLSLSRFSNITTAHPGSLTRQTAFDFNLIQDRSYEYVVATGDDGWLIGGGEGPTSYKLPNPDSAHVELLRVGTFEPSWGGVSIDTIVAALTNGSILIPHMSLLPSFVLRNENMPPELELKFDYLPLQEKSVEEWENWTNEFMRKQLAKFFPAPATFTPGPFHSTFMRKTQFRSADHFFEYFQKLNEVVGEMREAGSQYLEPEADLTQPGAITEPIDSELTSPHGVYLFKDRTNILRYFSPNFHPPYNTPEKRAIIKNVLLRD